MTTPIAKPARLGLIAGNGTFPLLLLDAARAQGTEVIVAAIKEETFPEIERRGAKSVHWISLGELSKLIDTFKREGVTQAVMAGQVKHKQIFSSIKPDWRLAKLLLSLGTRNTDSLLGAVAKVLADEGIMLENSTALLEPLLAKAGVLTKRPPTEQERKNIEYGRTVARHLGQYDVGQTVVIAESACVAVEAMEGTDATIARAGEIMRSLGKRPVQVKKDVIGFLGNRIQGALMREALWLIEQGVASPEDIDATVRLSFGFRYAAAGPIVQKEHSGWDTTCAVAKIIWPDLSNAKGPPPVLQKNVDEGRIGFKTKRGFFEWNDESMAKERARYERALRKCLEIFKEEGIV